MIFRLLSSRYKLIWVAFHILLGVVAVFSNVFIIVWFYFILLSSFYFLAFGNINRAMLLSCTMIYIGGFELLARMTKCSPVIPWEASKYLFTILSLLGIATIHIKSTKYLLGLMIVLLSIPAIFIDKSGSVNINDIIFNILGIINIGLGLMFFSSLQIRKWRFPDLLRLMIYPCITILTYTMIVTPDLKDLNFTLGAQFATSGEFGSNQVSTVLGLGLVLMTIFFLMQWKITPFRITDGFLTLGFLIQGLFTFSRGGMLGAGVSLVILFYYMIYRSGRRVTISFQIKKFALPILIGIIFTVYFTNQLTGGKLFLRYQGETIGTQLGTRDRDLTTMTSNRNQIFTGDLSLWTKYPILGSGIGSSKYLREEGTGIAAHVEISRLLAEQGIPGLIIFILILLSGYSYLREKDIVIKAIKLTLFTLAIFTTFHSATRTFMTPLLISLCSVNIISTRKSFDSLPGK